MIDIVRLHVLMNQQIKDVAILDTGSKHNLISKTVVLDNRFNVVEGKEIFLVFGNGQSYTSNNVVSVQVKVPELKIDVLTVFYVVENLSANIILGNTFLSDNDIIIVGY